MPREVPISIPPQIKGSELRTDRFLKRFGAAEDELYTITAPEVTYYLAAVLSRDTVVWDSWLLRRFKKALLAAGMVGLTNQEIRAVFDTEVNSSENA